MVLSRIRESPIQEQAILGRRCKKGGRRDNAGLSASSRVPSRLTLNRVSPDISAMSFRYKIMFKKSCKARENK